ncbi:MAG: helix-turn-helix domain-containing protein [Candidatus Hodarchaeota archaeon]
MEVLISTGLLILSIIFTYSFYNKLRSATHEYNISKDLVKAVAITAKISIDKQKKKIEEIEYELENIQSQIEQNRVSLEYNQEKIDIVLENIISILKMNKKMSESIMTFNEKINNATISRQNLKKPIQFMTKEIAKNRSHQNPDFQTQQFNLTLTEQSIIQVLLDEGPKTAPQIQSNIGKTREHTSRLLKKLWQEGYIDRETHSIPYRYRPSNELRSRINFS